MRYLDRKEFLYDPEVFGLSDTQTALEIAAEFVKASSPRPRPKFFEVDRDANKVDDLWHMPLTNRTLFSRTLEIPAIVTFQKPTWRLTKQGLRPVQQINFWVANHHLRPPDETSKNDPQAIRLDYFPTRGDMVYYTGYRLMIVNAVPDPKDYWQQTNVWTGLLCEAAIVPDGDAVPIPNLSIAAPGEQPGVSVPMDWPGFPPNGPTNIDHDFP